MPTPSLPLHQLQAFDAAARHLSFSRAAKELNVLGPAIGRQVALLEDYLATPLFRRTKPRLTLTREGDVLAKAVAAGFAEIRDCLTHLRKDAFPPAIVVNAAIGFTSFYLLPRMADLQGRHPEIEVQIVTRDQEQDYDPARCDAVVTFGTSGLSGCPSVRVIPERLVAICTPSTLAEWGPVSREDLSDKRLLHMSSEDHADDWARFFAGTRASHADPPQHDRFHSFMVYMRAIQNGMGVGLGWRPLIDDMLETGTLVRASPYECETDRGYFCSLTARGAAKPGAHLVLQWLRETAG
ncbi:MAG: LysR substrate-binding domain-containing protein [Pseudomonadota bacterium]